MNPHGLTSVVSSFAREASSKQLSPPFSRTGFFAHKIDVKKMSELKTHERWIKGHGNTGEITGGNLAQRINLAEQGGGRLSDADMKHEDAEGGL